MKTRTRRDRPQPELHRPEWADPIIILSVLLAVGGGAMTGCSKSESRPPTAAVAPAKQPAKIRAEPIESPGDTTSARVEVTPTPVPTTIKATPVQLTGDTVAVEVEVTSATVPATIEAVPMETKARILPGIVH